MNIAKYSVGMGDRFGQEAVSQLRAVQKAESGGVVVIPVWNKSFREHTLVGTTPDEVRLAADAAVRASGWRHAYHVDADHVGLKTVDAFLASSDFFTLDVADAIGKPAPDADVASFVRDMSPFRGVLRMPEVDVAIDVTDAALDAFARRYLVAVGEAGRTYRRIAASKGDGQFITEISVDEASDPQSALELFLLLGALARERVAVQTVAPKFTGKFLKGVDYVGDAAAFAREFDADLAVVRHAVGVFGLPPTLKLSVHTGSDKFTLYPIIRRALRRHDAGVHLKTAGTTWLEEVAGIALSGPAGLDVARRIALAAYARVDELCAPYATVVEIDRARLPAVDEVRGWTGAELVERLRNDAACPAYNVHFRQLLHVAFKVAAEMGDDFRRVLVASREATGALVTDNLFGRHIEPLFLGR
ncbi:MAG TPA: tagaturonate epimerase family protein [Polyangiaceae bacterium]|nr:tagaturonate epimerase family protein [Polyangiaceae bacterium]